ncbi:hypothetical protein ACQP3L_37945, partial [Escherichia coli]
VLFKRQATESLTSGTSEYVDNTNWTWGFFFFLFLLFAGSVTGNMEGLGNNYDRGAQCEIPKESIRMLC